MNKIEAKEKLRVINAYNQAQPIQHLSIEQEKKEYYDRLKKKEEIMNKSIEKNKGKERLIFLNSKQKFYKESAITEEMKIKEQEYWEEFAI